MLDTTQSDISCFSIVLALKFVLVVGRFNTFPALIKSKNSVSFDYFCSIFISRGWSAVILSHSTSPESILKGLQDGGGLVA